jgi:hypothetical protein
MDPPASRRAGRRGFIGGHQVQHGIADGEDDRHRGVVDRRLPDHVLVPLPGAIEIRNAIDDGAQTGEQRASW